MFKIARVGLHHFEEPCISFEKGSGTVFFSGCNLRCKFCQNYEISHEGKGLDVTDKELLDLIHYLVDIGAENINLVTPSNWTNLLIPVLKEAKKTVKVPFVWNSSGYETVANLKKLEGLIDIYLPDFKYGDDELAWEYSHAKNYFEVASAAISEMKRQRPDDVFSKDGKMLQGVIIRHLVLPNALENTGKVLDRIAEIDKNSLVSLMGQYFPTKNVIDDLRLNRRLTEEEYDKATDMFFAAGLTRGFSQELDSATEEYVPNFDLDCLKEILIKCKRG